MEFRDEGNPPSFSLSRPFSISPYSILLNRFHVALSSAHTSRNVNEPYFLSKQTLQRIPTCLMTVYSSSYGNWGLPSFHLSINFRYEFAGIILSPGVCPSTSRRHCDFNFIFDFNCLINRRMLLIICHFVISRLSKHKYGTNILKYFHNSVNKQWQCTRNTSRSHTNSIILVHLCYAMLFTQH